LADNLLSTNFHPYGGAFLAFEFLVVVAPDAALFALVLPL
jgi:hypothetical protein